MISGSPVVGASQRNYSDEICAHLHSCGFMNGAFADTTLSVPSLQKTFRLHALVLSRSPYFIGCFSASPPPYSLVLNGVSVGDEALSIALSHFYSDAKFLVSQRNASGIFQIAELFGMPDLRDVAASVMREDVNESTLMSYLSLVDPRGVGPLEVEDRWRDISDRCWETLLKTNVSDPSSMGRISALPFSWIKSLLEDPMLAFGTHRERFMFAKAVVNERERSGIPHGEETVVLSFGNEGGQVRLIKKIQGEKRDGRVLWKASGIISG